MLGTIGTIGTALSGLGQAASGLSGLFGGGDEKDGFYEARRQYNENLKFLKDQFYSGIQVRVNDAKAAGIHPLAALGVNPAVGGASASIGGDYGGSSGDFGSAISEMGQGITRAVSAFNPKEARELEIASAGLSLENQQLQNDRLKAEIALMSQQATPGLTMTQGGAMAPDVLKVPKEFHASTQGLEAGERAALQQMFFPGLGSARTKSEALGEAMEDSFLGSLMVDLLYTVPDLASGAVRNVPAALKDILKFQYSRSPAKRYFSWAGKQKRYHDERNHRLYGTRRKYR